MRTALLAMVLAFLSGCGHATPSGAPWAPSFIRPCRAMQPRVWASSGAGRLRVWSEGGGGDRWASSGVDDFAQRIESVKVAVIAGLAGSVASVPAGLVVDCLLGGSVPQWEYNTDMLAFECALMGIVYRYAVREDRNKELKDGVVGAFALTRGLTFVKASPTCLAVPLRCGAPLEYLDWAMLGSLGAGVVTSFVAFGAAARAIEVASTKGWVRRFPSSSE